MENKINKKSNLEIIDNIVESLKGKTLFEVRGILEFVNKTVEEKLVLT